MRGISLILCFLTAAITSPIAIGSPQDLVSTNDEYPDENLGGDYDSEETDETSTSKAQFQDQNKTIHVAEGSLAKLQCRVNNRDQDEQIMWFSIDKRQNQMPKFIAVCSVAKDVKEDERKDACHILIPNTRERFRDEGQKLILSNVTKDDETTVYKCMLAAGLPANPSIYLELKVHPSDWKETSTITIPVHQPQSQNLPTTETPNGTASGIKKTSFMAVVVFGLLTYIFKLHLVLPL